MFTNCKLEYNAFSVPVGIGFSQVKTTRRQISETNGGKHKWKLPVLLFAGFL